MSNTISDLNAALFKQLDRLNADDMNDDQIKTEVERTKAVVDIAGSIVESAELYIVLHALAVQVDYGRTFPNGVTYIYPAAKISGKHALSKCA